MHEVDQRVLTHLDAIQNALDQALSEAAGERMGYILLIVPAARIGEHIVTSNLEKPSVIVRFLRDAANIVLRKRAAPPLNS